MEAARAAAIRGDVVTLYEKGDSLGGHLKAASVPDFKRDLTALLDWYQYQLEKLRIEVRFNTEVTPELVRVEKSQKVIVATGSAPLIPNVPGVEKSSVVTCIDLLLAEKNAGDTVVVVGGGMIGCETGLWLALQGKEVTIVEMLPEMLAEEFYAKRQMILQMLALNEVTLITNTNLAEVTDEGISVICGDSKTKTIRCDTVALALGMESRRELHESLRGEISELYAVGDCREPRKILDAIWEGYKIGSLF